MNLIGQSVQHRQFGPGVVMEVNNGFVRVGFSFGEKRFLYPDAFETFLTVEDEEIERVLGKRIREKEAGARAKEKAAQAERLRREKLSRYKITPNSHGAFSVSEDTLHSVETAFSLFTGSYLSGAKKGAPRVPERMKPNSVCLLTARSPGEPEKARRIAGACMVRDDFFGEEAADGLIKPHPKYRLLLPAAEKMLFWDYIEENGDPRWGNAVLKYVSVNEVRRILIKMTGLLALTPQKEAARDFGAYFCRMNKQEPF